MVLQAYGLLGKQSKIFVVTSNTVVSEKYLKCEQNAYKNIENENLLQEIGLRRIALEIIACCNALAIPGQDLTISSTLKSDLKK